MLRFRHSTPYTFKYPDADKHKIIEGDQNYKYIESYMNELENALTRISLGDMTYRKYIDLHSFAKWFVAQEAIANWDPNMYFVMKSKVDKLEMGPFWDAEWCLGLADWNDKDGWLFAPNLPRVDAMIWGIRGDYYFKYMLKDLDFVRLLQEEWESFKIKIPIIKEKIRQESSFIKYSQQRNFKKWPILDEYVRVGLVALGDWQLEVDYTLNFFDQRVKWCDEYFNKIVFEGLSQN